MTALVPQVAPLDTATQDLLSVLSRKSSPPAFSNEQWEALGQAALRYRVAGLTLQRLRERGLQPPASVDTVLRQKGRILAARAAGNWWLFDKIAAALTAAEIPFIRLKGSHLARCVYSSPSHRFQRDFDILVHPHHLEKAEQTILAEDFHREPGCEHHHLVFRKTGAPFTLELHWDVQRRPWLFNIALGDLWKNAVPASDGSGLCLSVEDEIAYLCLHLSKHRFWSEVIPFLDILELLGQRGQQVCWRTLRQRFEEWQAVKPGALVLAVFARLFPRDIPEPLQTLLPAPPENVVRYATWRISAAEDPYLEERKRMVRVVTRRKHGRLWSPLLETQPGVPRLSPQTKAATVAGKAWRFGRSLALATLGGRTERQRLALEKELCEWC